MIRSISRNIDWQIYFESTRLAFINYLSDPHSNVSFNEIKSCFIYIKNTKYINIKKNNIGCLEYCILFNKFNIAKMLLTSQYLEIDQDLIDFVMNTNNSYPSFIELLSKRNSKINNNIKIDENSYIEILKLIRDRENYKIKYPWYKICCNKPLYKKYISNL